MIAVCSHCGGDMVRCGDEDERIILYLASVWTVPKDIWDANGHARTVEGIASALGTPAQTVYKHSKHLLEHGLIAAGEWKLKSGPAGAGRARWFVLTDAGRQVAERLRSVGVSL